MNKHSEVAKRTGGSGIRMPQFNAQQARRKAKVLSPTQSPRLPATSPQRVEIEPGNPESSREARREWLPLWGRGSRHLEAPGWGGSRRGPGRGMDAEPSSSSRSPPGPRMTRHRPRHPPRAIPEKYLRPELSEFQIAVKRTHVGHRATPEDRTAQQTAPSGRRTGSQSPPGSATRAPLRRW